MSVFLLLYLCVDATRTDCQVIPTQRWTGPDTYEQCLGAVPGLTQALSAPNRERHRFVCEIQTDIAQPAGSTARPTLIHQSFRM
ncbi:hypothetical protein CEQ51_10225 [Pseudomonas thivervalensis]|uniref:Uncharacterized protein n=1 Tax=Pseudomonas thivervalensis TaxID=86265 RepID=A0A2Z4Z9X2_9PSED|nr:hypothetical protein CE140_10385 [Pseudomonas thivervalensis]AXA60424.1 hypothetical protein CEQ51_10225 [Pseudomonas thivervalensis]